MQSYNGSSNGANVEFNWGYASGMTGAYRRAGSTVEIMTERELVADLGTYRQPSADEMIGLVAALVENGEIDPWDMELDWNGYADSVCSCYDLPDGRSHVCGNCLDASAARWGDEIPF